MSTQPPSLSFVVPVYRGVEHLGALVARLESLRDRLARVDPPFPGAEAIFVCDEPVDASAELLAGLASDRKWMTVLHLGRNAGQHAATAAGMLHASGDWVVTIDEDGQHDPYHALALLEVALEASDDLCYARPLVGPHASQWRNTASHTAKRLVAWLAGDPTVMLFNSFRVIRGDVARAAGGLASPDLYLDVALGWLTDRVCSLPLDLRDPRTHTSASGYSLRSLVAHFGRLVMSYHQRLLGVVTLGGFFTAAASASLGAAMLVLKAVDPEAIPVQGWTSLFVVTVFFGGLLSFLLGLAMGRLAITLTRAQGRPAFFLLDRTRDAGWRQLVARARQSL